MLPLFLFYAPPVPLSFHVVVHDPNWEVAATDGGDDFLMYPAVLYNSAFGHVPAPRDRCSLFAAN